jgi:hypothetical protein
MTIIRKGLVVDFITGRITYHVGDGTFEHLPMAIVSSRKDERIGGRPNRFWEFTLSVSIPVENVLG